MSLAKETLRSFRELAMDSYESPLDPKNKKYFSGWQVEIRQEIAQLLRKIRAAERSQKRLEFNEQCSRGLAISQREEDPV